MPDSSEDVVFRNDTLKNRALLEGSIHVPDTQITYGVRGVGCKHVIIVEVGFSWCGISEIVVVVLLLD